MLQTGLHCLPCRQNTWSTLMPSRVLWKGGLAANLPISQMYKNRFASCCYMMPNVDWDIFWERFKRHPCYAAVWKSCVRPAVNTALRGQWKKNITIPSYTLSSVNSHVHQCHQSNKELRNIWRASVKQKETPWNKSQSEIFHLTCRLPQNECLYRSMIPGCRSWNS